MICDLPKLGFHLSNAQDAEPEVHLRIVTEIPAGYFFLTRSLGMFYFSSGVRKTEGASSYLIFYGPSHFSSGSPGDYS